MLSKMNELSLKACMKLKNFKSDFLNDERGVNGIIVAVLLVAFAVTTALMLSGRLTKYINGILDPLGI